MPNIIKCPDCNEFGKFYSPSKGEWLKCPICKGNKDLKLKVIDFGGDKVEIWVPLDHQSETEE